METKVEFTYNDDLVKFDHGRTMVDYGQELTKLRFGCPVQN